MDRNAIVNTVISCFMGSLSARRAWIEISVKDLNAHLYYQSLSARRAWIEISIYLVEGEIYMGRSPQGERG